jgi:hypothetical protein
VPRSVSLPKLKYIPTPTDSLSPEGQEEFELMMQEIYKGNRYDFDISEYERHRQQLEDFLFYRKKFE